MSFRPVSEFFVTDFVLRPSSGGGQLLEFFFTYWHMLIVWLDAADVASLFLPYHGR
jgi:hypothetical protein